MMPRLEYFLVAEGISVDRATNRLSVFNVFEELSSPKLPLSWPQLVAASCWEILPEDTGKDFQATLRIRDPAGNIPEKPGDFAVNFAPEQKRHRVHHFLAGLTFDKPGDWRFEILLNGEHQATHVVTVHEGEAGE